ncbi:MAG: hypothetical protein QXY62_02910 [Candidatus Altiarchaeota archaeon]
MKRRGIIFTTGILAFALVILSLSLIILFYSQKMLDVIDSTMISEHVYNEYSQVEYGLKKIFLTTSGISIDVNKTMVTFKQSVPNGKSTNFLNALILFENFTASRLNNILVSYDSLKNNTSIIIRPVEIIYNQSGSSIYLLPKQINTTNLYDIYIESNMNITFCELHEEANSGSLLVKINISGSYGTYCHYNKLIDFNSNMSLDSSAANITLRSSRLKVVSDIPINITTKINVTLLDKTTDLEVTLPDNIIVVTMPEFNISKRGTVVLKNGYGG